LALRLVFMGTPDFAVPTLRKLVDSGHEIVAVYTRAPQLSGRGLDVKPSVIDKEARRLNIPVFTPDTLKGPYSATEMRKRNADAAVVVAFGLILPRLILHSFPHGCFNLHASLLPRWRGAAPINRAIMAGDTETGATIMKMDEGLDTGPIATVIETGIPRLVAERVSIGPNMTAGDLHDKLAQIGARLILITLNALEGHLLTATPQPAFGATYAKKIENSETRIDWRRPCKELHDHCRGLSPFPGAWFEFPGIGRVKVLRTEIGKGHGPPGHVIDENLTIGCGHGSLRLVELQRAGGRPMPTDVFLRGTRSAHVDVVH
jgi:methionyl-tRNA formyltransferase